MNKSGFTLIELLVVIAIIGILGTISAVGVRAGREKANIAKAQHEVDQISEAVLWLANDTDLWPGGQTVSSVCSGCPNNEICGDGCTAGISASSTGLISTDGSFQYWSGPYLPNLGLDPWGNEYFFDTDYEVDINNDPVNCGGGGSVDVVAVGSYGPDGVGNNQYTCDDIIKIIR